MMLDATILTAGEAALRGADARRLRVGLLVPMSGSLGMIGPSAIDAAELAAREINDAGGVDGRPLELALVDAGRAPAAVAADVGLLADGGIVESFVAFHASDTLQIIEPVVSGRVPYIFTPPHEGGERMPGVYCMGESPEEQLGPALRWLVANRGTRAWALIGNDYVWPRSIHRAARSILVDAGAAVTHERLVPLGGVRRSADRVVAELARSGAEGALLNLVGAELATFNAALRRAGLDRRLVRLSCSLEENGLLAFGGDVTGELYAAMPSFATSQTERRRELERRRASRFGSPGPVLDGYAEGCYDGVHLAAELAARGQLSARDLVGAATTALAADTWSTAPLGPRRKGVHLGVAEGLEFAVMAGV